MAAIKKVKQGQTFFDRTANKLAKECKLTEQQSLFCDAFLFATQLDAEEAVEIAGYYLIKDKEEWMKDGGNESAYEKYKAMKRKKVAAKLMNTPAIQKYINLMRTEMDNALAVDRLFIINGLKRLALTGGEPTQIKAYELLGKTMDMFTDKQKIIEQKEDPADIARKARAAREERINSIVEQISEDL